MVWWTQDNKLYPIRSNTVNEPEKKSTNAKYPGVNHYRKYCLRSHRYL